MLSSSSSSSLHISCPTIILALLLVLLLPREVDSASQSSQKIGNGYRLVSIQELPGGRGLQGLLKVKKKTSTYGSDVPKLNLFVKHETGERLRVHITDANKLRWEVPYSMLPRENPDIKNSETISFSGSEHSGEEFVFSFIKDPFEFSVSRKSNGQTLFNTSSQGSDPFSSLVFKDQYLEISTQLPDDASLYGLGENSQGNGIKIQPEPYTLYTTDISAINLNTDLYGSHPMYMDLRNVNGKGSAHAVLLLNSNGMDLFYRRTSLTYKIIGGVLDFYFFAGPSPLDVVDQYTALIGRPAPMPYWSFGFHQCRWGYRNLSIVESVVDNYKRFQIPLDVIWNDDDHMDGHKDFTLNHKTYPRPNLLAFLDKIHKLGMHYIVINDPGISINNSYGVYQRAKAKDVFIKYEGEPYVAQVWPGAVNFPDFLNPKTVSWWADEIKRFVNLVPIDGLWTDMNEVSNFCTGKCILPENRICPNGSGPGWDCCLDCTDVTKTRWDDPPYKINASGMEAPLGYKTIATSAVHYNGVLEYDAHSLYGFSESIATRRALQGIKGERPFILTRSTFVGSGKYAAHWTGDNKATWQDLKISISTMLNFGLFGVPMVGSDICGFYPSPTEELCNRWIQVGAFYPFSRDHANFYSPNQELYRWTSVAKSARNALGMRYKILSYLYTLNYEATLTGSPIARPIFFSFPNLTESYGLSTQFLLGSSVMVSPVLEKGKSTVTAFFPAGAWYSLFDMKEVVVSDAAHYATLDAPLNVVNVHVYQNTILPMQRGGLISKNAKMTPYTLVVTFPSFAGVEVSKGRLFLDNDELPEMKLGNGQSTYVEFYGVLNETSVKIWSKVSEGEYALSQKWFIEKVILLGVSVSGMRKESFGVEINGEPAAWEGDVEFFVYEQRVVNKLEDDEAEKKSMMIEIHGLNLLLGNDFEMRLKLENSSNHLT